MGFKDLFQLEPWKKATILVNLLSLNTSPGLLLLDLLKTVSS